MGVYLFLCTPEEDGDGEIRVLVEEFKHRILVAVISSIGGSDKAVSFGSSLSLLSGVIVMPPSPIL
jgi:hypothetical protein